MSEKLQITLLGSPEIRRDGQPITGFAHRKSLALLCYLAVTGKPHSRAKLAGLLWGNATEANARAGLRKSLAELRIIFGSNLLITRHEVTFNRASAYWLDVEIFDREAETLNKSQTSGLSPARAAPLIAAAALYRGDFLAGFHVLRAQAFEEWILLERERLRLSALRITYALAIHFLTQADYAQAISCAEQVLTLEPYHEEAHRLLMSLLALSGQQPAALHQYQVCRSALQDELGLEPDQETTALYDRIRTGYAAEETGTQLRPQLERPSLPLIGRRSELGAIISQLDDPRCRLLTLLGPGGSGKTHLAREIAATTLARVAESHIPAQKVFFISLGSSPTIESLTPALAQGVGLYFAQEGQLRRQLLSYLRRQHALLILDACEGLLDLYEPEQGSFVDLVNEILNIAPGIKILATSRARLNLPAETLHPLAGMNYPAKLPDSIDDLQDYDAVQLFLWRMRRVRPEHQPTAADLTAISEICRFAKGMPLEILLMANWARLLDPAAIITQLFGAATVQSSAAAALLKRDLQRNLTPVFDHSWKLLSSSEQHTLVTFSLFRNGFTYEHAHEISGISHRDLMLFVDQSLINSIDIPEVASSAHKPAVRYDMHDLLRDYIGSKPNLVPILHSAHEQTSSYYMGLLPQWADSLRDAREQEALQTMDMEITNIRAAWEWAAAHKRVDLLDQGLDGLCHYYQRRFRYEEGESACQSAVRALSSAYPDQAKILARAVARQAWFTQSHDQALELLDDSLRLLSELSAADVRAERALALFIKGYHLLYSDHQHCRQVSQESLALYQALADDWHSARVLNQLFLQSWKSGDYEEGSLVAQQCLALYSKIGYLRGYAGLLGDVGIGQLQAGLLAAGQRSIQESITIFEQLEDQAGIVKGLYFSSMALAFNGQWPEAEKRLQSCVSIGPDHSNFFDTILIATAIIKTHLGRYAQARDFAHSGLELAAELDNQMCIGRAQSALALAALGAGEPQEADRFAQTAVATYRGFGQKTELGLALAAQGYAACQANDLPRAQSCFNEALNLATAHKDQMSLVYAFVGTAYLLSYQGRPEQAVESFAAIADHPIIANSQWFQEIVKRRIDRAASTLPPEIVAAAATRGQALDLEAIASALMAA